LLTYDSSAYINWMYSAVPYFLKIIYVLVSESWTISHRLLEETNNTITLGHNTERESASWHA